MSQSWVMYQWRHFEPHRGQLSQGRWSQWHKCSKEEFDRYDDPNKTQKRVITCRPKEENV